MKRRIESTTSRTAEMTCISRACSYHEKDACYHSDDFIAPRLLPAGLQPCLNFGLLRRIFTQMAAPTGIYEYVIARTKTIDETFKRALADGIHQILIFGAGFDTRALRFRDLLGAARVFELDVPITQQAKISQYHRRNLQIPPNLVFVPIDFDQQSLTEVLGQAGFDHNQPSLIILEGLLMYLKPESVQTTFKTLQDLTPKGSRFVFDYVYASVLRGEGTCYGETEISRTVSKAGERWHFGIEKGQASRFLDPFGLHILESRDANILEQIYFSKPDGRLAGKINGAHCLVIADRI